MFDDLFIFFFSAKIESRCLDEKLDGISQNENKQYFLWPVKNSFSFYSMVLCVE